MSPAGGGIRGIKNKKSSHDPLAIYNILVNKNQARSLSTNQERYHVRPSRAEPPTNPTPPLETPRETNTIEVPPASYTGESAEHLSRR